MEFMGYQPFSGSEITVGAIIVIAIAILPMIPMAILTIRNLLRK